MLGVGVLWGFRPEELLRDGARALIREPGEGLRFLG
jgi:hypothetical protein